MKDNILQVRKDLLFHDLCCGENMIFLEFIVMQVLNKTYEEVHNNVVLENCRLSRISKYDKTRYVDLILRYKEHRIIVELNNHFKGLYIRNIFYVITKIINCYKDNKNNYYTNPIKATLINLNWYDYNSRLPKKRKYKIPYRDDETKGNFIEMININLDKYAELAYNKVDTNEKLYKLFTITSKRELLEFTKDEPLLETYTKRIIEMSSNKKYEEDRMSYTLEKKLMDQELYLLGEDAGIERGIERGVQENKRDVVLEMYKDNINVDTIAKYVKLTVDKVKEIIDSINKDDK